MKKLLLFIAIIVLAVVTVNAQQTLPAPNFTQQSIVVTKGGDTQSETPVVTQRHCGTMEHLEWMKQQDPTLEATMEAENKKFNDYITEHQEELENNKAIYTMPVVVHVVYNGSSGYVAPSRVTEQITQTNSDWAGTNGRSMESFASSLRADCGITLCLATKDPTGGTTTGIDYKTTTKTSFTYDDGVKSTSTGGANAWDVTKYLNIWVCNLGSSLCGYAQFPPVSSTYGVVIHYAFFGLTGATYPYNGGGTTSHEFGHCFNLYHIWGDDGGACSGNDQCNDVPNQADAHYGNGNGIITDACSPSSPGIMYINFMDYSDDADYANMTPNQATRMQNCVASYLTSVANYASTACNVTPQAPVANFTANATTVPEGTTVIFTDQSTNSPTSWSWNFGGGGTPNTSTAQNPSIVFNTAGTYTVTLTATNAIGSDSEIKNSYITVTTGSVQTCDTLHYPLPGTPVLYGSSTVGYLAGNNSYGDLAKADYFATYAPYTTLYGAYFWFARATDLGSTTNITFNVWNNGGTGGAPGTIVSTVSLPLATMVSDVSGGYMTAVALTTPLTIPGPFYVGVVLPQSAGDTLALVTNTDGDTNPGTGWEQFNDNVWHAMSETPASWGMNLQTGIFPIVCTNPVGIPENGTLESVLIYPNPANDVLNVNFMNYGETDVKVNIYNAMGELVKSMNNSSKILQIDMSNEVSGIYYVTLVTDEGTVTKKVSLIK